MPFNTTMETRDPLHNYGLKLAVTDFGLARWLSQCQGVDISNLPKKPSTAENSTMRNTMDAYRYGELIKWYDDVVKNYYLRYSNKQEDNGSQNCPEQRII